MQFFENEIPIKFNWIIIRTKSIEESNTSLVDFLTEFEPLQNEFLSVICAMGSEGLTDIYYWIRTNKLKPFDDYYVSNDVAFMGDKDEYPDTPKWLTIFKNEKGLFADYLNTKKFFFTNILEYKNSMGNLK